MSCLRILRHPRSSILQFRDLCREGWRSRQWEAIPFDSGLRDSAWLLHGIARSLKPEVCVEIGSARGKSACYVARALSENGKGKVYAIDPHRATTWNDDGSTETYEIMCANLAALGLSSWVEIVRLTSAQAAESWDRKIDLLFIDGDHSYEGVKQDWEFFSPHVSEFGMVVFHDTIWERDSVGLSKSGRYDVGVPRFVEELRRMGYPVVTFPNDCGVSLVQPTVGGVPLRMERSDLSSIAR